MSCKDKEILVRQSIMLRTTLINEQFDYSCDLQAELNEMNN